MKNKLVVFTASLMLALLSTACAAQDTANEPGDATAVPTISTNEITTEASTATEEVSEAEMTPTGAVEGSTTAEGTEKTTTTPTVSAEGATPAQGAGGTAGIPQTGPGEAGVPDDLQDVMRVLQATGATVEVGDEVQQDSVTATGRIVMIDGEEVRFFTYSTAELLEREASQLANKTDPESEPRYYKLGNMLVFYGGRDPGVRDLLEDVLGAQEAGQ